MKQIKKISLVTGASSGIGQAIAISLAKDGNYVILNYYKNEEGANLTLKKIKENNGDGECFKCDVSDSKDVEKMFIYIKKKFNRLDVLINNAGITIDRFLLMMSKENFDKVMNTNIGGCFNCTQNAVRLMCASKTCGSIINISSTSGIVGQEGQTNYSTSKGAIISFTKSVAKEYAKNGIRVNAVAPGFIETKMVKKDEILLKQKFLDLIPLKRFGRVEEIANIVSFLASDKASYITGECIVVDGGLIM